LYLDHLRELVPEANFWTMTQGKILKNRAWQTRRPSGCDPPHLDQSVPIFTIPCSKVQDEMLVSNIDNRQHLQSASCHLLFILAFDVAGRWLSL